MAAKSNIYSEKREDDCGISSDSKLDDLYNEDELTSVYFNNLKELGKVLKSDIYASFAKWLMFVTAVLNRRSEELTIPIPADYIDKKKKCDFILLIRVINATPGLFVMSQYIKHNMIEFCIPKVINLLHWILVQTREYHFRTLKGDELFRILSDVKFSKKMETPIHVFEIMYPKASRLKLLFKTRAVTHKTYYGFCGYPMDRMHESFLNGMRLVHGAIHLRNDLSEILKHCTTKFNGNMSLCGSMLRCVLLCQYINDNRYVKCFQDPSTTDLHIFSQRWDIVLPRYLFFYGEKPQSMPSSDVDESIKVVEKKLREDKNKFWTVAYLLAVATFAVWLNWK